MTDYTTDFSELGRGNADWNYERIECCVYRKPMPYVSIPESGVSHF